VQISVNLPSTKFENLLYDSEVVACEHKQTSLTNLTDEFFATFPLNITEINFQPDRYHIAFLLQKQFFSAV
jgi:hypothetical protein